ncbi:MAG: hypothetical protein RR763_13660, partial [Massilia sp.]
EAVPPGMTPAQGLAWLTHAGAAGRYPQGVPDGVQAQLERELALTGATTVLTMGQVAANGLLGRALNEPLAGVRGQVHALGEVPLVATLHPGELLLRGADKALAWADLCRARSLVPRI